MIFFFEDLLKEIKNVRFVEGLNKFVLEGVTLSLLEHSYHLEDEIEDIFLYVGFVAFLRVELTDFLEDFVLEQALKDIYFGFPIPDTKHLVEGSILRQIQNEVPEEHKVVIFVDVYHNFLL